MAYLFKINSIPINEVAKVNTYNNGKTSRKINGLLDYNDKVVEINNLIDIIDNANVSPKKYFRAPGSRIAYIYENDCFWSILVVFDNYETKIIHTDLLITHYTILNIDCIDGLKMDLKQHHTGIFSKWQSN